MIPKGGKYAKSVVNFVHKAPKNWVKFKSEIEKVLNLLKGGKLRLHGKQTTIFESNKNILKTREKVIKDAGEHMKKEFASSTKTKVDLSKYDDAALNALVAEDKKIFAEANKLSQAGTNYGRVTEIAARRKEIKEILEAAQAVPASGYGTIKADLALEKQATKGTGEKILEGKVVDKKVKGKEDPFKGWTPTLVERSNLRNVYKDKLNPPERLYTKEMEAIDEELDALSFGGEKYARFSVAEKNKLIKKLQAEMDKLIKVAKENDPTKLSLSQINKKSQDLQKRIRLIADDANIKGDVHSGPKRYMIKALYDSENPALTKARHARVRKNSELKYGKKYPVLDPENEAFIITGLDEFGHPNKVGRFTGRFSALKDPKTGELTRKEGTSYYDKWNAEKNQIRKANEEVFHETVDAEGKTIMSNPDYKIPEIKNMEIWNEIYSDLSINDLAKKGHTLKDIDMLVKGREVYKHLKAQEAAEPKLDIYEKLHERTDHTAIKGIMEDLYLGGDDVYKMPMQEWIKKIPEYFAGGGRAGFHRGSLRHQKTHDYRAYEKSGDWLRQSPPENWLTKLLGIEKMGAVVPERDDFETMMKERFMYGEKKQPLTNLGKSKLDKKINAWIKELFTKEKRNKHATGGISNLFRERQGFRSGKAVELVTKLPEFLKFVERLLIKASNEIRQGIGKWKGLDIKQKIVQHDNLTKLATEFQKTKKFDKSFNEYFGIDAEKAFVEAQAKVKKGKIWKSSEGETQGIAMGFDDAGIKALDQAMKKGTALSDAMKKMGFNVASANDTVKFDALVSEGMIGFSREMKEQIIRAKYGDVVSKELLNHLLTDSNPQRLSEVMGTIDEGVLMHERGMGTDEIITTLKESFKRKPNVEGGLIPGYATGGVSNLFRSR